MRLCYCRSIDTLNYAGFWCWHVRCFSAGSKAVIIWNSNIIVAAGLPQLMLPFNIKAAFFVYCTVTHPKWCWRLNGPCKSDNITHMCVSVRPAKNVSAPNIIGCRNAQRWMRRAFVIHSRIFFMLHRVFGVHTISAETEQMYAAVVVRLALRASVRASSDYFTQQLKTCYKYSLFCAMHFHRVYGVQIIYVRLSL